ncbi:hypothetical protein C8T65DRAFT_38484 [Cerioporus squamosus]|nr:hypothetical protein C8T65DRAFT_38484 [Cerioporus squamosus]
MLYFLVEIRSPSGANLWSRAGALPNRASGLQNARLAFPWPLSALPGPRSARSTSERIMGGRPHRRMSHSGRDWVGARGGGVPGDLSAGRGLT